LGVTVAYALALTAYFSKAKEREELIKGIEESSEILRKTRPTAVKLFWAVDRIIKKAQETSRGAKAVAEAIVDEVQKIGGCVCV